MIKYDGFQDLLKRQADACPERQAFHYEDGGRVQSITYRSFQDRCLRTSQQFRSSGKTCLGVLCDGSLDCVTAIFASVLSGMQTVLLDENATDELLAAQIRETDIDLLWGDEEITDALTPSLTSGCGVRGTETEGKILFFTSGTTSRCKAVVLTDRSLMASAYNGSCMLPLTPRDILLCVLPLNHVFGFVCSLLWGLSCGACVALGRGARHYLDDPAFFAPTALSAVPALLAFLLKHDAFDPALRLVLVGAGDCPSSLLEAAAARGVQVSFGYGMTETSSGVAISTSGDPYALSVCPEDTISIARDGEILVQAPTCMMEGYYRHPEMTEEVLRDGILCTGDLGRLDADGKLHITGRKKEMLVLPDGNKIFLPEYEAKLSGVLAGADLAVIEKDHAPALLIRAGQPLREHILGQIRPVMDEYPRGQQIREIIFTETPLPRTSTGKLRRWELKAPENEDTES